MLRHYIIFSFNPHHNLLRWVILSSSLHRWGIWAGWSSVGPPNHCTMYPHRVFLTLQDQVPASTQLAGGWIARLTPPLPSHSTRCRWESNLVFLASVPCLYHLLLLTSPCWPCPSHALFFICSLLSSLCIAFSRKPPWYSQQVQPSLPSNPLSTLFGSLLCTLTHGFLTRSTVSAHQWISSRYWYFSKALWVILIGSQKLGIFTLSTFPQMMPPLLVLPRQGVSVI